MTDVTKLAIAGAVFSVVFAAAMNFAGVTTSAQEGSSIGSGDPIAGKNLVENNCGSCHSSGYAGLLVSGSSLTQDDIAQRVVDRTMLLRVIRFERHPTMPKFLFSELETNAILAYFAQLRSGDAQQPSTRSWTDDLLDAGR